MPETPDARDDDVRPAIVGIDGSRDSVAALKRAMEWSRALQVPIVVVFVRHAPLGMDLSSATVAQIPNVLDAQEREARKIAEDLLDDSRLS